MTRFALLGIALLVGCTSPSSDDGSVCEAAAEHVETCLVGMVAARPATCGPTEQERSSWVLQQSCSELLVQAGDGKADGVPAMQGVRIRRVGNRTYFSIPLASTVGGDQKRLLDESIAKFSAKMGELNQALIARGLDVSTLLTGPAVAEFTDYYTRTVDALVDDSVESSVELELGRTVARPTQLSSWRRYAIPQAFISYISTKFSVNWGISGGVSATVMIVIQPWLTLAVDHTLAQPQIVDKLFEVDAAMLGVPNVDIGLGAGASLPFRIGVGAVFGPIDQPNDLARWGVGLSGGLTLPVLGGVNGKFIGVLRSPPLFMLLLGYSTGTGAEVEVHGNLQKILDLDSFLAWLGSLAR
jgi:hypothetical protein